MYGSMLAVADPAMASPGDVARSLQGAGFDDEAMNVISVGKGWAWLGRLFPRLVGDLPAPYAPGARIFTSTLPADVADALARVTSPEEADALVATHGEDVLAVVQLTDYGPAFVLSAGELEQLAAALAGATVEQRAAAAAAVLAEGTAYPMADDVTVDEVLHVLTSSEAFLAAAAQRGDAVLYGVV